MFEEEKRRRAEELGEEIIWALADGFLLYWHPVYLSAILDIHFLTCSLQDVVRELDIRLFLRVSHKTLKQRRDNRYGYHTAGMNSSYQWYRSLTAHMGTPQIRSTDTSTLPTRGFILEGPTRILGRHSMASIPQGTSQNVPK